MICYLEIQFSYIGMNNSHENGVRTRLLVIISDLYLVGCYCHDWLLWKELTDKNRLKANDLYNSHRLSVQLMLNCKFFDSDVIVLLTFFNVLDVAVSH